MVIIVNNCGEDNIEMAQSNGKRIAKNTAFLYARMLFVMLINIFSVRFVLKGLGVVDYGVFNVVAGLVTMFSSLSSVISSATLRFHSYAIGEGEKDGVSKVFTASFNIYAALAILVLVVGEIVGVWFINTQADIPADRMVAANWLFQFSMVSFVVELMTTPFTSLIFAFERMQVFSIISVTECILNFLLALSLLSISFDSLIYYGLGLVTIKILHLGAYFILAHHGGGKFHYLRNVEHSLYKRMLTFSGWTLFTSMASIGISQLVTMVTNVFFGPVVNAARAIAYQVNGAMSSFTNNIIMAIKPPMIKYYAEGNHGAVNNYFQFSNKAIFYGLLLVLLPIFFEMKTVLHLWLDVDDAQTIMFCRLILVYALVLSLNNPISIIIQATGNIRAYSTYVEIPTLLCFPATWVLYALGYPAETAFYVMIIAITISHVIRLICLKKLFPLFSYREYLMRLVIPGIGVFLVAFITLLLIHRMMPENLFRLLTSFVIGICCVLLLSLLIGFTKSERKVLFSLIKNK